MTQTANKQHFKSYINSCWFFVNSCYYFKQRFARFPRKHFSNMANKKQSPRKGVPYRFQGNEAIGAEMMSSAGTPWDRDDAFRRGPCPVATGLVNKSM